MRGSFIIRGEERPARTHHRTTPHGRWWWKAAALEEVAGHPRGTIGFGGDPEAAYTTPARLILSRSSTYGWRRGQVIGVLRDAR